ncbi:hypothetical protein [Limosilactobacillus mucosae]|uniref:Uncharacterized protein n=1 Tax=Limosilactobacillus mucosae TaxID=97478 RepID=A0A508YSL4_LIMMU|nr:hypothetical protein [Limosilactobacillus mucosae]VTZ90349.1 hypothetical protein LMUP508_01139 [Limosilactobacillus mucosae]
MRDRNEQQRSEMYEDVSAIQADIKDLHNLFRIDLKNLHKKEKENSRAITEIGLLLIISIFVNICMFALLFFIVLKG